MVILFSCIKYFIRELQLYEDVLGVKFIVNPLMQISLGARRLFHHRRRAHSLNLLRSLGARR